MKLDFKMPKKLAIVLAILAGVVEGLNVTVFGLPPADQQWVTIGVSVMAILGINPLVGPALDTALHLTHATVIMIGTMDTAIIVAITTTSWASGLKETLVGVLTLIGGAVLGTPAPVVPITPAPASLFTFLRR